MKRNPKKSKKRSLPLMALVLILMLMLPIAAASKMVRLKESYEELNGESDEGSNEESNEGSTEGSNEISVSGGGAEDPHRAGADAASKLQPLEVHFIDVGQGDCTLIRSGDKAMLIDAGSTAKGTAVQLYLKKHGVTSLKYVVATHPDEDHIGGMPVIITKFDIGKYFAPEITNDTKAYENTAQALKYKGITPVVPAAGDVYALGDAEFTIISAGKQYDSVNDGSLCLRLVSGRSSFLFVGDAEEAAEEDMLRGKLTIKSDVLKTGHHGSKSSSMASFVNAVAPKYAVISCGYNNDYGHPHMEVLELLRENGVNVFRTDEQGDIVAISDGEEITWNDEPSTSWKPGNVAEPGQTQTPDSTPALVLSAPALAPSTPALAHSASSLAPTTAPAETAAEPDHYIININTNVFHKPSCPSVSKMKEKNKRVSYEGFSEIRAMGYKPCGNCLRNAA